MRKTLTKKQRKFVNEYADTGNGTHAAIVAYEVDGHDPKGNVVARSIASENLTKPHIQEELRKLGFDSNNAKRVVGEILLDETIEPRDRLNAADKVFKVNADYAPEKHENINVNVQLTERARELADRLLQRQRG